jgi:succinate dehydrogenase/fumarate reductase-like Fe-S protein
VNTPHSSGGNPVKIAHLKVSRGTSRDARRYQEYQVPFEDGESVLDALVRIRTLVDPDLAFQFSCFNANVCKECAVLVNGVVEYACIAKLKEGVTQVDPLPDQPLLRDLTVDMREQDEKGSAIRRGLRSIGDGSAV